MKGRLLAAALAYDIAVGELPATAHPVVVVGSIIRRVAGPPRGGWTSFTRGAAAVLTATILAWSCGATVERTHSPAARALATFWLLKASFALRPLLDAAARVRRRLGDGDLPGARGELRWLVSRDRSGLDSEHIASAAIESVAENLSDSFVAPLLAYRMFGLPGALAYRAINTADAMLGYHGLYEYLGKFPARLDDVANLLPSRLTAIAIAAAAPFVGGSPIGSVRTALRDAASAESPNAGWPMAAAAGVLGVWLEKPGVHAFGTGSAPTAHDIDRVVRLSWAVGVATAAMCLLSYLRAPWLRG